MSNPIVEMSRAIDEIEATVRLWSDDYASAGGRRVVTMMRERLAALLVDLDADSMPVMHSNPQSQGMRAAALPRSGTLRRTIVELIHGCRGVGATDDEIEDTLGRSHQSISAARNGLVSQGWVIPKHCVATGGVWTRDTRAGNPATVWVLSGPALFMLAVNP